MIPLLQLPCPRAPGNRPTTEIGPLATAIVLALIVCLQIGLLLWAFLKDWGS